MLSVLAVKNSERESISVSKMITVWLSGPKPRMPAYRGQRRRGHRRQERLDAALEVEVVIDLLTVASSGKPSVNRSVPSRVSTLAGMVIEAGISWPCGLSTSVQRPEASRNARPAADH